MLVYGDHREFADPPERLDEIAARLAEISTMPAGLDRHAKLVGALIEAGRLLQGVEDAGTPAKELNQFVYRLAAAVVRSWDSRFARTGELPRAPDLQTPPPPVELRVPEGFAFYAVYPEAYAAAARRLRLSAPPCVIGIRSIGTTLGAMVAAALGAPPPVNVRPYGDPFARQVELPPELTGVKAHFVIVDEGPGLSGSSFGSVADALEQAGVPRERIAFLASHAGELGPRSSPRHRERWAEAQRVAAGFDPAFLARCFGPLREHSTGHPWERRKYLAGEEGDRVLLKFAGLGVIGERKLEIARALHAAGFTAEPLGLAHGFLVERWRGDAQPLRLGERPLEQIGRYIGARALLFPAHDESGASIAELAAMSRRNISLRFGPAAAGAVDRWDVAALSPRVDRVRTDNKLDRDEWMRLGDGRLLKADALDHHQGHDLVGCQDIAWDIAGAIVEFDLDEAGIDRLVSATGRPVDRELLGFCRLAYCAFRLGAAHLAAESSRNGDALLDAAARYAASAEALLLHESDWSPTRQESLVD